jgi:hypothetical protein
MAWPAGARNPDEKRHSDEWLSAKGVTGCGEERACDRTQFAKTRLPHVRTPLGPPRLNHTMTPEVIARESDWDFPKFLAIRFPAGPGHYVTVT